MNWTNYGIVVVAVWGVQVTYDHLADSRGRLAPMIFYVASSIVWPFTVLLVIGSASLVAWRKHRPALRASAVSLWHRVRQLRIVR